MRIQTAILALSLAIPAVANAQTPPIRAQRPHAPHMLQRGPDRPNIGEFVLKHREQLDLSSSQVLRIRNIQTRFEQQSRPLIDQLAALRPARGPEQRPGIPSAQRDAMRKRMDTMRDSARVRVRDMTQSQRDSLRSHMQKQNAPPRPPVRAPDAVDPQLQQQRAHMLERHRELQPAIAELRSNAELAAKEIQTVLTDAQKAKLRELRKGSDGQVSPVRGPRDGTPAVRAPRVGR